MKIRYTTLSERGRRSVNEDAFRVSYAPKHARWMGIVCDGMGGHAMGEMASDVVITKITEYWEHYMDVQDSTDKVLMACRKASAAIDEATEAVEEIADEAEEAAEAVEEAAEAVEEVVEEGR